MWLAPTIPPPPAKHEFGALPLVGGDTDFGVGVGAFGTVAKLGPGGWKLEFGVFYATKGALLHPSYEDAFVLLTLPRLFDKRLRLQIGPA